MNKKILTELGLTESEIKVYFALLEIGQSSVGPVYKKAGIADSKIYFILDKLKEKGLVSFVIKNNVKHFQASDPKNLIKLLNERENEIKEQKEELLEKVIPEIEQKRKSEEKKQEATVYEGFKGLKSAFNLILDNLTKDEEYQVFMLGEQLEKKEIINFFENYHKKRIEKGIKARLISEKKFKDQIKKWHSYKNMKIRYTNQKLPVGQFIFRDHVMTVVLEEKLSAFVIKSKKNYEYWKEFFEEVWQKAES